MDTPFLKNNLVGNKEHGTVEMNASKGKGHAM